MPAAHDVRKMFLKRLLFKHILIKVGVDSSITQVVGSLLNLLIANVAIGHGMSQQHVQWIVAAFLVIGCINSAFFKVRFNSSIYYVFRSSEL